VRLGSRVVFVVLVASVALADAEVVLRDGRVLRGADVRRDADLYLLQQDSGTIVPLPLELVVEIRLLESQRADPVPADVVDPVSGLTRRRSPRTLAGYPNEPEGMDSSGPRQLVGEPIEPPRTSEQLAGLGKPARFARGVIDSSWTPVSGWMKSRLTGREPGSPVRWSAGPVDPSWEPRSAFPRRSSLEGGRSSWPDPPIDPSWQPRDGF